MQCWCCARRELDLRGVEPIEAHSIKSHMYDSVTCMILFCHEIQIQKLSHTEITPTAVSQIFGSP